MLNKKNGYTLAEVLVVMTLLGILAAILLPAVAKIRPDRDKMMFKKAYYVAERVIYEIANDDDMYPTMNSCTGFECTNVITIGGNTYGAADNTSDSDKMQKTKFCGLFARKVNTNVDIKGYSNDDDRDLNDVKGCLPDGNEPSGGGAYNAPSFYTSDGVAWYMPASKFEKTGTDKDVLGEAVIYVDVNGAKKPNCISGANGCNKPDIFKINVIADGKMYVDGEKESEYLKSNSNVR